MIWVFVVVFGVLMVILGGQAVMLSSLRMRVAEAEDIIKDQSEILIGVHDSRRTYVAERTRIYATRWGKVKVNA
jgi:hypothetical protein